MTTDIITRRLILRAIHPELMTETLDLPMDQQLDKFDLHSDKLLESELSRIRRVLTLRTSEYALWNIHLRDTSLYLGNIGIHTINTRHRRGEIGYYLNENQRRKGYMSEAAKVVLNYGFENLNLNRITAHVHPDNLPSRSIILKLGFQKEGLLRQDYIQDGIISDSEIFGLLKSEYVTEAP